MCRLAREYGPGLVLVVFLGVLIGLTPESRQSMLALPILVTLLVKATEQYRWPVSLYWFLGVAALVFSKVWLRINAWPASEPLTDADLPRRLNRYFMNQGPYMPNDAFVVQSAAVLVTGLILYLVVRSGTPRANRGHLPPPSVP